MKIEDALYGELRAAEIEFRDLAWIRITTDALQGSVVSVPVTPERARRIRLYAYEEGVDVDPALIAYPPLELLVHPADWLEALRNFPWWVLDNHEKVVNFLGVPIVRD